MKNAFVSARKERFLGEMTAINKPQGSEKVQKQVIARQNFAYILMPKLVKVVKLPLSFSTKKPGNMCTEGEVQLELEWRVLVRLFDSEEKRSGLERRVVR